MISRTRAFYFILFMIFFSVVISGCTLTLQKGRRSDIEKIRSLDLETDALNAKLERLRKEKQGEVEELAKAKKLLENQLKKEIEGKGVRLEMAERGLAIIFLAEVLFDSGKADIKENAFSALDKVAKVFKESIGDRNIGVEGHTDNEPIKHSGWKSNWELSTARATSVLHYLVDKKGINPKRLSATGYGEHKPTVSNDTPEGRRQNRRVEIVVLPNNIEKIQADIDEIAERKRKIEKRLKKYEK